MDSDQRGESIFTCPYHGISHHHQRKIYHVINKSAFLSARGSKKLWLYCAVSVVHYYFVAYPKHKNASFRQFRVVRCSRRLNRQAFDFFLNGVRTIVLHRKTYILCRTSKGSSRRRPLSPMRLNRKVHFFLFLNS